MCCNSTLLVVKPGDEMTETETSSFIEAMGKEGLAHAFTSGNEMLFAGEVFAPEDSAVISILNKCRADKPMSGIYQFGNEGASTFELATA